VSRRLEEMEGLLSTFDRILSRVLASEEKSKTMVSFFTNLIPE
jgi:hypothetical protein